MNEERIDFPLPGRACNQSIVGFSSSQTHSLNVGRERIQSQVPVVHRLLKNLRSS